MRCSSSGAIQREEVSSLSPAGSARHTPPASAGLFLPATPTLNATTNPLSLYVFSREPRAPAIGSPVGRRIRMQTRSFIGLDVHKATISISIAEDGRNGSVRFLGVIPNAPDDIAKMAKRLSRHGELDFCYEASGCGYGIHRQLTVLGHR